ncbi:MAG TPA: tRNA pseudouridine(38-40) synthase TruA, partial [Leifsonia sp.]|nr:tRNA pseudouridine(38-40) synthase TruA [Leifsonia sp.]
MTTETTRFRLDIAYQGTDFNGWALQPGLRTVQGEIESALATIFRRYGDTPALTVAGRTDAGVHAIGQVAHVDLTARQVAALLKPRGTSTVTDAGTALARRVNGILGPVPDIVITAASQAPDGFDARFSAIWRRYEYRVADSISFRDPLQRHRTSWLPTELDLAAMDAAALSLLGLHDFAS